MPTCMYRGTSATARSTFSTPAEDHANQKRGGKEDQDAYDAAGAAHHEEARPGQPGRLNSSMSGEVTGPREDGLCDRAEQGGEVLADTFGAHVIANHG